MTPSGAIQPYKLNKQHYRDFTRVLANAALEALTTSSSQALTNAVGDIFRWCLTKRCEEKMLAEEMRKEMERALAAVLRCIGKLFTFSI